jgi:catechol 2,3-dioxygenase-like lactoylglutathione lyase family enzyme
MLKRIKFASVPVEDQERALDFYTKKLGWETAPAPAGSGDRSMNSGLALPFPRRPRRPGHRAVSWCTLVRPGVG